MTQELSGIGEAIREAHAVADDVTEAIREAGSAPSSWRVGLTETEPEVLYESSSFPSHDASPHDDTGLIVRELSDGSAAQYVLRELAYRGCQLDSKLPDDEASPPTIVYLYRADSTD